MYDKIKKSILEMAGGGFMEVADLEMTRAIANILDPNTKATAKRKVTITLSLTPDDQRQNIAVACEVKSALAPVNPLVTMLYAADKENVTEMTPQIPGQVGMDGEVQTAPPMLRIINM